MESIIIVGKYFTTFLKKRSTFRAANILHIVSGSIPILVFILVFINSNSPTLNINMLIIYYIFALISRSLTGSQSLHRVSQDIINGVFSKYLLLPRSYLLGALGEDLENNITSTVYVIPIVAIIFIIFKPINEFSLNHIVIGIISLFLGFLINFILSNIVALSAFFIQSIWYTNDVYFFIKNLLAGTFIPIYLFPDILISICNKLPFIYIIFNPIQILTNQVNFTDSLLLTLGGLIWLIVLFMLYKILFKLSVKYYSANGG